MNTPLQPLAYAICCLLILSTTILTAQTIQYKQNQSIFNIQIAPPSKAAGANKDPFWSYYWEFGDGHSSQDSVPKHCYANSGIYDVRLHLTPYYSHDSTRVYKTTVDGRRVCTPRPVELDKWVNIETSASNEMVPDNTIRVNLTVQRPDPTSTDGYLIFLYNDPKELKELKMKFDPVLYLGEESLYGAQLLSADELWSIKEDNPTDQAILHQYLDTHDAEGFYIDELTSIPQSLHFTIGTSSNLDTIMLKDAKDKLEVNLKALWFPGNRSFDYDMMYDEYPLTMLSVHDPNRLRFERPRGMAYYNPKKPSLVEMKVDFQNLGGKAVKRLDIDIPWKKNLNHRSLKITKRNPDFTECPTCPTQAGPMGTESCFTVDTSFIKTDQTMRLTYHNVHIHGKREEGVKKKYSKGYVQFSAKSNKNPVNLTRQRAVIKFEGGEAFRTNVARKFWRHRSFGIRLGRSLIADLDGYEFTDDKVSRWYTGALFFKDQPVGTGVGWGVEIGSAGLGMIARWIVEQPTLNIPFTFQKEEINLQTLDAQGHIEFKFLNVISAGVGGGVSIPLKGKGILTIRPSFGSELPMQSFGDDAITYDNVFNDYNFTDNNIYEGNFGLLDSDELDLASGIGFGSVTSLYAEVGLLRNFAIGGRASYRVFPNSFKGQCIKIAHAEAYLRIKLFNL